MTPPTELMSFSTKKMGSVRVVRLPNEAQMVKKKSWTTGVNHVHVATPENPPPIRRPISKVAAFVAPYVDQSFRYAQALNYNPKEVILCSYKNYDRKLAGITPDEDFIVHVCGSWLDDDADFELLDDLAEVEEFLKRGGFEIERVNRLGEKRS